MPTFRRLPHASYLPLVVIGTLFMLDALLVFTGLTAAADRGVLLWVHSFASPVLDRLAFWVTQAGNVREMLVLSTLLAAVCFRAKRNDLAAKLLVAVGGAALTTSILKALFHRPRPELWPQFVSEANWSFPSGHATGSMAMAAVIVLLAWRSRWRWWLAGIGAVGVLLIGLSRLYLGVHYPSDILAGWCVGAFWALVASRYVRVGKN